MTIAELLRFSMCLLWKLSVSVAAVLLVSWAYRFYSSRDAEELRGDKRKAAKATCRSCKTTISDPNSAKHDAEEENEQAETSHTDDGFSSDNKDGAMEKTPNQLCCNGNSKLGNETRSHQEVTQVNSTNPSPGSPLKTPHHLTESEAACATGRRSPHSLQHLESIVGVRRELRQELECQGAYSSFLSKTEVKVEDASVLLEGAGDQTLRRKIYNYYVESSSRCVTESDCVLAHSEAQPLELRSSASSLLLSPSSMSPITMRNLGFPQGSVGDSSSVETVRMKHRVRPVLLRNGSYLSATERSELSIPLQTPGVAATVPQSPASNSRESTSAHTTDSEHSKDPGDPDMRGFETVAGSPCPHYSSCQLECNFLERFKGKIDLGNCVEALDLAKKHRQTSLQQAALEVMSDNYLQVLREPNIYGWLLAGERVQIQERRMRGTHFVMVAHIDPQDCPRSPTMEKEQNTSSAIYYYEDQADTWQPLCLIPQEVVSKACAVCTMDNYLFVAVGCQGTHGGTVPSKRVFCFNPLTSIWKEISPMNEARPCCKLAALEGYVYAIGGECLSSVERYDPREDKWTFVAPLPNNTFAVAHQVTVSNGELYVSGGTFKCMLLCYSPKTNSWRSSLLVGSKDKTADMVAVRRCLYRFDINPILGVSVYRYHTGVRLWYKCSSKQLPRCPAFHCVALDDTIFCVSRHFTMRFLADEIAPAFLDEHLSVLSAARGMLFPFVLSLPDKKPLQTSV